MAGAGARGRPCHNREERRLRKRGETMLNVESVKIISTREVPEPKRSTALRGQLEKLLPKIATLTPGQVLAVPYESGGKKWRGRQYLSAIQQAMSEAIKRGHLDRWYNLRKDASKIYIIRLKPQPNGQ
jgi:hypothetical protein